MRQLGLDFTSYSDLPGSCAGLSQTCGGTWCPWPCSGLCLSPTLPQLRDAASRGSSPVLTAPLCGSKRDLCSDFTSVNPSPAVSPGSCSKTDWEGHAAGACVCVAWVGTCAPLSLRSGLTPIYSEVSMLIWQALVAFGKFAGEAALQETTQGWRVECTTWLPRRIHCSRGHCLVA